MLFPPLLAALGAQAAFAAPNILNRQATGVTVNVGTTYQTMDGFGFSQAFGRANDLYNLPSAQRTYALDLLFSTTAGAGFTILRNRIGSGGVGDSIEPTAPSSPTASPTYIWDGNDTNQVWVSQQAKSYGVTTFYADAWSAPGFMKTNDDEANGGYLCGVTGETCSSGSWLQAYANFLVQYINDYASVGIAITNVGFLNEPELTTTYSSMLSDGQQAADFIKVLYPTLQAAGLSSVGITCCDAEGWDDQKTYTANLITYGAEPLLSKITSHAYTSQPDTPINTTLRVWQTEYTDLSGAWSTTWYSDGALGEGLTWANLLYTGIVNANCSAYLNWEGIENSTSNSGLIHINGTTSAVTPSSRLWAYGHFSRHVRPGSVRVGTTGAPSSTNIAAFKNPDGTVSVHMINNGASSQSITLSATSFTVTGVAAWITNQEYLNITTWAATLSSGEVSASVPAYSLVTFVLSGTVSTSTSTSSASGGSSSTSSVSSKTSSSAMSTTTGCTTAKYGQCGGENWTGCTVCASGSTCTYENPWYSQCL